MNSKKYAVVGASAFIFNNEGKLLLVKSPKQQDQWCIPGGKIEYGEKLIDGLEREVAEETNLKIKNIEYFKTVELTNPPERPGISPHRAAHPRRPLRTPV